MFVCRFHLVYEMFNLHLGLRTSIRKNGILLGYYYDIIYFGILRIYQAEVNIKYSFMYLDTKKN